MEGLCRLHLHSLPPFRRPPTNILSIIIVGLRPIIVVHRQIIVDLRPILSYIDKLLSASDINIVDRRPVSADCRQCTKKILAVYEILDLRITNERFDTLRLASEDICHSLLRKKLKILPMSVGHINSHELNVFDQY